MRSFKTFRTCFEGGHTTLLTANNTMAVIRANSVDIPYGEAPLSDPRKPEEFDALNAFYDSAKIWSATLYATFESSSSAATEDKWIAIIPLRTATVLSTALNWDDLCNYPRIKFWSLSGDALDTALAGRMRSVKYQVNIKSFFQGTVFSNAEFSQLFGANPVKKVFFHVLVVDRHNGTISSGNTVNIRFHLFQKVQMFKRDQAPE